MTFRLVLTKVFITNLNHIFAGQRHIRAAHGICLFVPWDVSTHPGESSRGNSRTHPSASQRAHFAGKAEIPRLYGDVPERVSTLVPYSSEHRKAKHGPNHAG